MSGCYFESKSKQNDQWSVELAFRLVRNNEIEVGIEGEWDVRYFCITREQAKDLLRWLKDYIDKGEAKE